MATTAFLMYENNEGELVGTWIGHMGGLIPKSLAERFGNDFDAIAEFIEKGSLGGGWSWPKDEAPYWEPDAEDTHTRLSRALEADYNWLLTEEGKIYLVELVEDELAGEVTYRLEI